MRNKSLSHQLITYLTHLVLVGVVAMCALPQTSAVDGTLHAATTTAPMLLMAEEHNKKIQLQPVDPVFLTDKPKHAPIALGHHLTHTVSPDGRTLAAIVWPSDQSYGGALQLIDLATWTDERTKLRINGYVRVLVFSQDGKALYWVKHTQYDPAHGMPRDYDLYRYDLRSQSLAVVTKLPSTFVPEEMRLLRSGLTLAIFGVPIDAHGLAENAPHVLVVDLRSGAIGADVRLTGVTAGQLRVETPSQDEPSYQFLSPGLAWDLQRNLLYVVHADEDKLSVVDLGEGKLLKQMVLAPRRSPWDFLRQLILPTAEAKLVPGTNRHAVLSDDGTRLYVAGLRSELTRQPDGEWQWREIPLGVQVIDTSDGSEIRRLELPVGDLALSPDGRWLLLTGAQESSRANGSVVRMGSGLYLFDAKELEQRAHLLPDAEVFLYGFSPDSRYAYLTHLPRVYRSGWSRAFQVLDLESQRLGSERKFSGYGELLPVGSLGQQRR